MIITAFLLGAILGILSIPKVFHVFTYIIKSQMKIFERQCRIFYILRSRYKNKEAIKIFNKGNK
jgi:hypothetical protein